MMAGPMGGAPPAGNGGGSAEWIDYSDYGFTMNPADNSSLWDNFNPHQMGGGAAVAPNSGGVPTNGDNFELSYHSVFGGGGQSGGFGDGSYGMAPSLQQHQQPQLQQQSVDNSAMDDEEEDENDDDEGLPLEPDVSFAEHEDNFDALHLEPVVQMADD